MVVLSTIRWRRRLTEPVSAELPWWLRPVHSACQSLFGMTHHCIKALKYSAHIHPSIPWHIKKLLTYLCVYIWKDIRFRFKISIYFIFFIAFWGFFIFNHYWYFGYMVKSPLIFSCSIFITWISKIIDTIC